MSWTELGLLALATFGLSAGLTWLLIPFLKARQLGKAIREDGPAHQAKAGTPTMGGLGMLVALSLAAWYLYGRQGIYTVGTGPGGTLTKVFDAGPAFLHQLAWPLLGLLAFAILGALDDWQGLARKGRAREIGVGITARRMIVVQVLVAVALVALLAAWPMNLGAWHWARSGLGFAVAVLAIVGTVNGVNFSDGLDGLATGLLALAFAGLAGTAWLLTGPRQHIVTGNPVVPPATALALVAVAACLGFLLFNRHPARVFMGNVASMGLGGLLAGAFLAAQQWYLLPIVGAVFVAEVLSDIIQIGYFKVSGGKRVFRMAPLHHHFEAGGWPETKVVRVFWFAGLVSAVAGVAVAAWLAPA